jgi:Tol biopolymer transport system component
VSEYELAVADALDTFVPLRLGRLPDWDDVLVRADVTLTEVAAARDRHPRWPRRHKLLLAIAIIATLAIAIGSALAALGSYPFGSTYPFHGIRSWLGFSTGPASHPQAVVARPSGASQAVAPGMLLSWSPDGSRLLVSGRGGTYVIRADGTSAVRVAPALAFPSNARWSPNGRTIAYDDKGVLYLVAATGQDGSRPLAQRLNVTWNGGWSWSPSGRQIVYTGSTAEGQRDVFLVNTEGPPRPRMIAIHLRPSSRAGRGLAHSPSFEAATWSPDGSRIAFEWDDGRSGCCGFPLVYVTRPDGTHLTRLHRGWIAGWSPNGDRLAFAQGVIRNTKLFVIDADGTGLRQLWCRWGCDQPTWFPDGSKLAYRAHDGTEIVIANTDGTGRRPLIAGIHSGEGAFAISPNGSTIAYVGGHRRNRGHYLYLVNADGSNRRLIAHSTTTRFMQPIWRPTSVHPGRTTKGQPR